MRLVLWGGLLLAALMARPGCGETGAALGHPRLYFSAAEVPGLRKLRGQGEHARIWKNLAESAEWCLTKPPRSKWIAPASGDMNLYDRFNGMMQDMASMEHLAFAYAYSGEPRYLDGARTWTLACCRIWKAEAEGAADTSKAYAVMRLLKGLAIAYDLLYPALEAGQKKELREAIAAIGQKYYQWYLKNPSLGLVGGQQGSHHSTVEVTSFGVVALALLGEVPEAADWLALMEKKFAGNLLPRGLTPSGSHAEGPTFWTSTMQYRLMFMDALRRVTGRDLFAKHQKEMDGGLALAKIAAPPKGEWDEYHESALFEPSYGQLNYFSPVLVCLAREYRRSVYQRLALWDAKLGALQKTRYVTPNGEAMVFGWGGYAYAWYDPGVPVRAEEGAPLSFEFPETHEAYARAGYEPGGLLAGCRMGHVVIHAGGRPVLISEYDVWAEYKGKKKVPGLKRSDDGKAAVLSCRGADDSGYAEQTLRLERPRLCVLTRKGAAEARWWCQGQPKQEGDALRWPDGTVLRVTKGKLVSFDPAGHFEALAVANGRLKLADPMPMRHPAFTTQSEGGELALEVRAP